MSQSHGGLNLGSDPKAAEHCRTPKTGIIVPGYNSIAAALLLGALLRRWEVLRPRLRRFFRETRARLRACN